MQNVIQNNHSHRLQKYIIKMLSFLKHIYSLFKEVKCNHFFKASDLQPRDNNGLVKWQCCKCKKIFTENCGLDILKHGKCDGNWGDYNKYIENQIIANK